MSTLKDWMDSWPLPDGEPFKGETVRADGWMYHDFPRMKRDALDQILDIIGDKNIKWMTFADYGNAVRGQAWISPRGIQNLQAFHTKEPTS